MERKVLAQLRGPKPAEGPPRRVRGYHRKCCHHRDQTQRLRKIHLAVLMVELVKLRRWNGVPRGTEKAHGEKHRGFLLCPATTCVLLIVALTLAPGCSTALFAQSEEPTEYQVKAAFLLNFAKFVEWLPDAFPSKKAPLTLCVFRHNP